MFFFLTTSGSSPKRTHLNDIMVCWKHAGAALTAQIMSVLQLPPSESLSRYVSLEFLYGTNGLSTPPPPPPAAPLPPPPPPTPAVASPPPAAEERAVARWYLERALRTSPSSVRDRLMFCASTREDPSTSDMETRSEPARSISFGGRARENEE